MSSNQCAKARWMTALERVCFAVLVMTIPWCCNGQCPCNPCVGYANPSACSACSFGSSTEWPDECADDSGAIYKGHSFENPASPNQTQVVDVWEYSCTDSSLQFVHVSSLVFTSLSNAMNVSICEGPLMEGSNIAQGLWNCANIFNSAEAVYMHGIGLSGTVIPGNNITIVASCSVQSGCTEPFYFSPPNIYLAFTCSNSSAVAPGPASDSSSSKKLSGGAIAGIVVGVVVLLCCCGCISNNDQSQQKKTSKSLSERLIEEGSHEMEQHVANSISSALGLPGSN